MSSDSIILYSTHCPKCIVLEKKLNSAGVEFQLVNDVKAIIALGYRSAPILVVGDKVMDFTEANSWVNEIQ